MIGYKIDIVNAPTGTFTASAIKLLERVF